MTVSFGIEFEFDFIDRQGVPRTELTHDVYTCVDNWGYQYDGTAGAEIRSPVFTSIEQAITEIKREFEHWLRVNAPYAPYPFSRSPRSLGQHMHIGTPERSLTHTEKRKIAYSVIKVYPFLASIHAQPLPSERGLNSRYAYNVSSMLEEIPISDHYAEVSDSGHGTLELRVFDSNIPQVSLVNAFIVTKMAERALNGEPSEIDGSFKRKYREDRSRGLRYGLYALDIPSYIRTIKELGEISEVPDVASIKEILYLVARYGINAFNVLHYSNANRYKYFSLMFSNPDKFLDNVLEIRNIRNRDKIARWKSEASNIENIDQLLGIAIASYEAIARQAQQTAKPEQQEQQPTLRMAGLRRSEVQEALRSGAYVIARISEVEGLEAREVAQHISYLLDRHGEGFVNSMSPDEVIETPKRFYVMCVRNPRTGGFEIVGTVAIHINEGVISSLVVDRRFRQLGIARALITHVLNMRRGATCAYVRYNNTASLELFESLGFTVQGKEERSYRLVREVA